MVEAEVLAPQQTDTKSATTVGYKFIQSDMTSKHDKTGERWVAGQWRKHDGELEICGSGFHACETPLASLSYVYGDLWFVVEARGKIIRDSKGKFDAEEMRLVREIDTKTVCVRFAIACARRCLHKFEEKYPNDLRPRKAIEAAEAYLKHPSGAARAAAGAAAWAAGAAAEADELDWQNKTLLSIIAEESLA